MGEAWRRRMNPPENELPVALAWTATLGRSPDVAVAVVGARTYGNGIVLDVAVRARIRPPGQSGLFGAALDEGSDGLRIGVEFADGRTTGGPPQDLSDDTPLLFASGGHGGDRTLDQQYFLTPLPPPGPLTLHCTWPALGIEPTSTDLDTSALPAALTRVQTLWPATAD